MATTEAIGAASSSILELLAEEYDPADFGGLEAEFSLERQPLIFGVSFVLWHVEPIEAHRSPLPPRSPGGLANAPAELTLTLHYALTSWAADAVDEQHLLGWAMRVLHDRPVLSGALLNTRLQDTFEASEHATLALEPIPSDRAWQQVMGAPHAPPTVGYVVQGVVVQGA